MLSPELLSNLGSLELQTRQLVESLLTGPHRGRQRGDSVDFSEHREYTPGDDVRYLDWKLYGRRDRFLVRQFEDEKQLQVWCLIDHSGSMSFRSAASPLSKQDYAAILAAALVWVACSQQDQATFMGLDGHVTFQLGPAIGLHSARQLTTEFEAQLAAHVPHQSVDEDWNSLNDALGRITSHSVVFVFSDFFASLMSLKRMLKALQKRGCDTRLVQILDEAETTFPFSGTIRFEDLEGQGDMEAITQSMRQEYLAEFEQFLLDLRRTAGACSANIHVSSTTHPPEHVLRQLLAGKAQR